MSQELAELRQAILQQEYARVLSIVDELDSLSQKATLRNIRSYLVRLLIYLIKNQVEQRLTNSWAASIRRSLLDIQELNQRDNSWYIQVNEWQPYLERAFEDAIYDVAAEVFEGQYTPRSLMDRIDIQTLCGRARSMIEDTYACSPEKLSARINEQLVALPGGDAWQKI